jgi:hypothetical protein
MHKSTKKPLQDTTEAKQRELLELLGKALDTEPVDAELVLELCRKIRAGRQQLELMHSENES